MLSGDSILQRRCFQKTFFIFFFSIGASISICDLFAEKIADLRLQFKLSFL